MDNPFVSLKKPKVITSQSIPLKNHGDEINLVQKTSSSDHLQ